MFQNSFPQKKKTGYGKKNSEHARNGNFLLEEEKSSQGHQCRPASQDNWDGREGTAFLEEQKKENGARADAHASQNGVSDSGSAGGLIPVMGKPERRQVNENSQCSAALDHKAAQTVADLLGGEFGKDLMQ